MGGVGRGENNYTRVMQKEELSEEVSVEAEEEWSFHENAEDITHRESRVTLFNAMTIEKEHEEKKMPKRAEAYKTLSPDRLKPTVGHQPGSQKNF